MKNNKISKKERIIIVGAFLLFSMILSLINPNENVNTANNEVKNDIIEENALVEVENKVNNSQNNNENIDNNEDKNNFQTETNNNLDLNKDISLKDNLPKYNGKPYEVINNNKPKFSKSELTVKGYEKYDELDNLGRCKVVIASLGIETMPKKDEKRGSISNVNPSGFKQAKYDNIKGKYLYNRCHLIGWQLSAENDNKYNLITGTKYLNISGMLPFENMVHDYIIETKNHVAYRVTPIFENNNLVASGVQIEGYSIEDKGEGICFNVYCFNVQPGINIDYSNGSSSLNNKPVSKNNSSKNEVKSNNIAKSNTSINEKSKNEKVEKKETNKEDINHKPLPSNSKIVYVTPTGKRYHLDIDCAGKNGKEATLEDAKSRGLTPCKNCAK